MVVIWIGGCGDHSLYDVVSPSLYDTHPEYFSEIEGKRIQPRSEGTQLCLTNPELPYHAINSLNRLIQKHRQKFLYGLIH